MYDLILRNGLVADGSGAPLFKGDIGIEGDSIVKIGDLSGVKAENILDCEGLIVAPGFIDIHNHSDASVVLIPTADNYVMQGVTTIVIGNCGSSVAPISDINRKLLLKEWEPYSKEVSFKWNTFEEYLGALEEAKPSINIAALVGHGTIREAVLGMEGRDPSSRELKEMKFYVKEAMEAGCFGISTGLIYAPGVFSKTDEIVSLAKIVGKYGGIYASHIRNESDLLLEAVTEAIHIGESAGVPVEISHLKASGSRNWGLSQVALDLIACGRTRKVEVTCDVYPYTAAMTGLLALMPPWVREGGIDETESMIKESANRKKIVEELKKPSLEWENIVYDSGMEGTLLAYSENYKMFEGKSISQIAREVGRDPYEIMFEILEKDGCSAMVVVGGMCEEDVQCILKNHLSIVSSDGGITKFGEGKLHPRFYGTFPRIICKYVKEKRILTLEDAIRKMTSMPAWKLRLWDRGLIRPGMKADITVFDYRLIKDTSTFENPHSYPEGIKHVIINGKTVVEEGVHTGIRSGSILKRS